VQKYVGSGARKSLTDIKDSKLEIVHASSCRVCMRKRTDRSSTLTKWMMTSWKRLRAGLCAMDRRVMPDLSHACVSTSDTEHRLR